MTLRKKNLSIPVNFIFSDKNIILYALDVEKTYSNMTSAMKYYDSITEYMNQLRDCIDELRDDIEYELE